ncbi:MAG TPA: asparagine synthase (glutamine-hydrolyzing) [Cyanobacteria bacterium UBA8803]|nr:asparagine synthase (glutamine-hydrolyzing) [Cyanobacteria bacterium UBA9273]HBL58879.1 asparagine synthase (glutamine-hydrolyzing) [Cyanobacteria bacterium UBA8803]
MCGIVGILNLHEPQPISDKVLPQMLSAIRHRGPDEFGIYRDEWVNLGNARLSIIDLSGGQQPISNEDGTLWIVFNGEIFNYLELRPELEALGHRFTTNCDTEVILHLYEEYGLDCLNYLNGQFAIAIWNTRERSLFLARDRLGIRPLFYTVRDGQLVFGSEIKTLLAHPNVRAEINPASLAQVFTFWSVLAPHTIFKDVYCLPPAHYMLVRNGQLNIQPYWELDFATEKSVRTPQDYLDEFEQLLIDSTLIRLRADVPVGAYLSGGLDSSTTTAIIRKYAPNQLDTFSIAFSDPEFDESEFQQRMAGILGTEHRVIYCQHDDISRVFPDVIWHTEIPTLRTAPAPMFMLSGLVRNSQLKVVLTGEGADEILGGYDIFKEMVIRRFWAKQPDSQIRPLLLKRLYPEISRLGSNSAFLTAFFKKNLTDTDSPFYSHALRWSNTSRLQRLLLSQPDVPVPQWVEQIVPLPTKFKSWSPLAQAQFLEIVTFMSPYLLSSQGDRVAMANSVEGRFPFLDYRVVEFCNRLPSHLKLRGLTEKWLLRQLASKLLPADIWQRRKRPYRAPIHRSFFHQDVPDYVSALLSEEALRESGLFNPLAVNQLVRKAQSGAQLSEVDDMAIAGVLSSQLIYQQFVKEFNSRLSTLMPSDRVKVVDRTLEGIRQ